MNSKIHFSFYCPACSREHFFLVPPWNWNNNTQVPDVDGSVETNWVKVIDDGAFDVKTEDVKCHLLIRDGQIHYEGDCSHEMAGKTVPMQEY